MYLHHRKVDHIYYPFFNNILFKLLKKLAMYAAIFLTGRVIVQKLIVMKIVLHVCMLIPFQIQCNYSMYSLRFFQNGVGILPTKAINVIFYDPLIFFCTQLYMVENLLS